MKVRAALASGDRGAQSALEQLRCVDKSTVSIWNSTCKAVDAVQGKVEISQLSHVQPSHFHEISKHFRKKDKNWGEETKDEIADWVDRCESESWTVAQLREELAKPNGEAVPLPDNPHVIKDLNEAADQGYRFGTIYADPPWRYGNQATRAATSNHYSTMTVEEIAAMPIGKLAAEQSHLWLWTTNGFLFECPKIFEAWGFEFKSSYVWCKPQIGIGNYLRNAHELLLLATRGGLVGAAKDVSSWGVFDRREHSAKPEEVRINVVEKVSPGPRLELFARVIAPGWYVYGNQIERDLFTHGVPEK